VSREADASRRAGRGSERRRGLRDGEHVKAPRSSSSTRPSPEKSRRVEGFLAADPQRRRNHDTFRLAARRRRRATRPRRAVRDHRRTDLARDRRKAISVPESTSRTASASRRSTRSVLKVARLVATVRSCVCAWTAANRRMTASSVGHVPSGTRPPCVLVLLGFRRPYTTELTDGTTSDRAARRRRCCCIAGRARRARAHGRARDIRRPTGSGRAGGTRR